MKRFGPTLSIVIALGSLVTQPCHAGEAQPQVEKTDPDLEKISKAFNPLFSNDNPTFGMLGIAPSDIQSPETPSDLAAGILSGIDQRGNFQQGFAMEFAPAQLFFGRDLTVKKYREDFNWLERSLARLQFGVGVSKGSGENDPSLKIASGFVWQPINGLDPLKNSPQYNCIDNARLRYRDAGGKPENAPGTQGRAAIDKALKEAIDTCRKEIPVNRDNTFNLQLSAAFIMNSPTGKTTDLEMNGYSIAANASIGLSGKREIVPVDNWRDAKEQQGRLLLTGGYRAGEQVPDPANKGNFLNRDRLYGGGRLSWGVPQRYQFGLESVYQKSDYRDRRNDGFATVIGSIDYRISDKLWLGAKLGTSFGSSVAEDATFIGTTFKFALGQR
jgi:hypothetical protein